MDMKDLEKNYNDLVRRRIKEYRILKNISQEELGKYLNLPKQAISRIEKGKRRVTIEELEKISLFFDEPLQAFVKEEYKYVYPADTPYGVLTVYMAEFLEDYRKALGIDAHKNISDKLTKKFISAVQTVNREVKHYQKYKKE